MSSTIFYSWQSDLPNPTNRNFIEDCLNKAIRDLSRDMELENAERPDLQLDKDTKGAPGSPPIADTIFRKVDECTAFVVDISFVGQRLVNESDDEEQWARPMPNANVMIEYGYAVKSKTIDRILRVMNVAFGGPKSEAGVEQLPFDMKHLGWPVCYNLPADHTPEYKEDEKAKLIKELKRRIELILQLEGDQEEPQEQAPSIIYADAAEGYAPSTFLQQDEKLVTQLRHFSSKEETYYLDPMPHAYLRLIPRDEGAVFNGTELKQQATEGSPLPFLTIGRQSLGANWGRNKYGFVIHNGGVDEPGAGNCVQIFLTGEVWAVCASFIYEPTDGPSVLSPFEDPFIRAFKNYRAFLQHKLDIPQPYKFVVGINGIEGTKVAMPPAPEGKHWTQPVQGLCIYDHIRDEGVINQGEEVEDVLLSFFRKVWDAYDLPRPGYLYGETETR